MANTYYDSQLTAEEIEEVLEAISGILTPANNGKVLAISDGKFEARSVRWGEPPTIESLSVTENGTYTVPEGVDGYSPVTVNVEPNLYPPEDPDYIMDHAGDLICTVGGRPYYKTTSDKAYVAYMYNGGYTGPFLISEVADGVKYTTAGQTFSYSSTVVHNNKTYYVGSQSYWWSGNQTSSNGFAKKLSNSALNTNAAIAELFNKAGSDEFYVTSNGQYSIPSGYDGYKEVVVDVDTQANVQALSVTQNGTYTPPSGVDGYSPVTVSVPSTGGDGNVITGTEIPTASVGDDGDFYLRQREIPSTITFLEYLQSSGTQYIDTGIYATELIDVYCKAAFHVSEQGSAFGARTGSWTSMSKSLSFACNTSQNIIYGYKIGSTFNGDSIVKITFKNSVVEFQSKSSLFNGKYNFQTKTDSTTNMTQTNQNTFTSDTDIRLFGLKMYPSGSTIAKCRIYRLTVYQAGAVIADYLPCLDSNNVPCMYEAISGTFVYNTGTGDFAYGEEIQTPTARNTLYLKEDGAWVVIANDVEVNVAGGGGSNYTDILNFEQGTVGSTTSGAVDILYPSTKSSSNARIRSQTLFPMILGAEYTLTFNDNDYEIALQPFNWNAGSWGSQPDANVYNVWKGSFSFTGRGGYIAIVFRRKDGGNITPSEMSAINFSISISK